MKDFYTWFKKAWPLFPAALYLIGFLFIVLIYLAGLSLSDPSSGIQFPSFIPFLKLFKDSQFIEALKNTIVFTIVGTPLELMVGLVLALLLYRSFVMRGFIRSIFLVPLALPALVTAMLLYILFDFPGGHINNFLSGAYFHLPALVKEPINWRGSEVFAVGVSLFGKIWRDMPISMLILLSGLNSIDPELYDAAKTMGASSRRRLFLITIPLILPSISVVLLLRSVEMWKEFIFPFVLAGRYNLLGTLIDFLYNDMGNSHEAAAVAMVMVACIVLTTALLLVTMEIFQKILLRR